MKTILVSTDFSDASVNAGKYGIAMAEAFNAKIILFNAYQAILLPADESSIIVGAQDMKDLTFRQLEDLARELNITKLNNFEIDYREGPIVPTILQKVHDSAADLIIAGMKIDFKGFRKVFGSTVLGLLHKSQTPMIVVPEGVVFRKIETVALAFESDISFDANPHLLDTFREIAERFHSHVYIVRISDKKIQESFQFLRNPYRLMKMVRSTDPIIQDIPSVTVQEGLASFINDYHVDILGILPHQHSWLERLFKRSTTETLIFGAHIPLLIMPELARTKISLEEDLKEVIL